MKYSEIYNRIADTYFTGDREHQAGRRQNNRKFFLALSLTVSTIITLVAIYFIVSNLPKKEPSVVAQKKSLSVLGNILPLKIEYKFQDSSEKVKSISLDLPKISLNDYDTLEFALRGDPVKGFSSLIRLELLSSRKEKKAIYIRGIDSSWKNFKIPLRQIPKISSFTDLDNISFVIESWNADKEQGCIFIDKIRFTKEVNQMKPKVIEQ